MAVNKVVINDEIKIDLTSDTVSPDTLSKGITAHDKSGNVIIGQAVSGGISLGGQSSRKYCGSNQIKTGDFVSSYVFPSSNITSGEFNFPAARVLAACHYKDDIYIFCFYNYYTSDNPSVRLQAIRINGGLITFAGPAYTYFDAKATSDYNIHLSSSENDTKSIYFVQNGCQYKDILRVSNNHIIFSQGCLVVLDLDESSLALNKIGEDIKGCFHLHEDYYYSWYENSSYYGVITLYKVEKDGAVTEGASYSDKRHTVVNSVKLNYSSSPMSLVKTFSDNSKLFVTWTLGVSIKMTADLETLSIKTVDYRTKTHNGSRKTMFYPLGEEYCYWNITGDSFYARTFFQGDEAIEERISLDEYEANRHRAYSLYTNYIDGYFQNYCSIGADIKDGNLVYEKGYMATRQLDVNGNVIQEWKNQSFTIIDDKMLFRLVGDGEDPWGTKATVYHINGEGVDTGVLPYTPSLGIYGVAISDSENNFVNIKTPKEV